MKQQGEKIPFRCFSDCQQLGCPGHMLQAVYDHNSDALVLHVDEQPEYYFDRNSWRAAVRSVESL